MARKSVLLAPADQPEKCRKATESGADAVVYDLEDGVLPDRRPGAREAVADLLVSLDPDCEVWVRVNGDVDEQRRDVRVALAETTPDAVVLPKAATPADVDSLADRLAERVRSAPIVALVESAAGVLNAQAIAAAEHTDALVYGAEDLAGDLGATRTDPSTGILAHARERVLLAARAAAIDAIDTHHPAYEDDEGLREATEQAMEMGYDGKLAIHPRQIPVLDEGFTPDDERIEWAKAVLDARDEAAEAGEAVFVDDGEMIDAPQIRRAERILDRAPDVDWPGDEDRAPDADQPPDVDQ